MVKKILKFTSIPAKVTELRRILIALQHIQNEGVDYDVIVRYVSHKTKIPMHKVKKVFKFSKKLLPEVVAEKIAN